MQEFARNSGAKLTDQFSHVVYEVEGVRQQRHARTLTARIGDIGPAGREESGLSRFSSKSFERIAIIGNKDWRGWAEDLMQAIVPADIRFFETIYQDEAHKWLRS